MLSFFLLFLLLLFSLLVYLALMLKQQGQLLRSVLAVFTYRDVVVVEENR